MKNIRSWRACWRCSPTWNLHSSGTPWLFAFFRYYQFKGLCCSHRAYLQLFHVFSLENKYVMAYSWLSMVKVSLGFFFIALKASWQLKTWRFYLGGYSRWFLYRDIFFAWWDIEVILSFCLRIQNSKIPQKSKFRIQDPQLILSGLKKSK